MSVLSFDGKNDTRVIGNGSGKLEKCDDVSIIFFRPDNTYIFLDTKYPAPKERRDTDELI